MIFQISKAHDLLPSPSTADQNGRQRLDIQGIQRDAERPIDRNDMVADRDIPPKFSPDFKQFVDTNDLKVLLEERRKERPVQDTSKKKSRRSIFFQRLREKQSPALYINHGPSRASPHGIDPVSPCKETTTDELSPTDRMVRIGMEVPLASLESGNSMQTDLAADAIIPLRPCITFTPAGERARWSDDQLLGNGLLRRPYATSSVYSQPTPDLDQSTKPLPCVPDLYSVGSGERGKAMRLGSVHDMQCSNALTAANTHQSFSAEIADGHDSPVSNIDDVACRFSNNAEVNRHLSQGWWTYISLLSSYASSPVDTENSTESSSTPSPAKSSVNWFDCRPPCICETQRAVTVRGVDEMPIHAGWNTIDSCPNATKSPQVSEGYENDVLAESPLQLAISPTDTVVQGGAAAEYYHACAYELSTGTPYFECINHVCCITTISKIAAKNAGTTPAKRMRGDLNDTNIVGVHATLSNSNETFRSLKHLHKASDPLTDNNHGGPSITQDSADQYIRHLPVETMPQYVTAPAEKAVSEYLIIPVNDGLNEQQQPPTHDHSTSPTFGQAVENGGSISLPDMRSHKASTGAVPPSNATSPRTEQARFIAIPVTASCPAVAGGMPTANGHADDQRHNISTTGMRAADKHQTKSKKAEKGNKSKKNGATRRICGYLQKSRSCIRGYLGPSDSQKGGRRRWYFAISLLFIFIIVIAAILGATLATRRNQSKQFQWANLSNYPPMPMGVTTIVGTETQAQTSGCIKPSSLWSCALPKEQQILNRPYAGYQPNFEVRIGFRNDLHQQNGTHSKLSTPSAAGPMPSPLPPSDHDQIFIGNTTDHNAEPYAGEETPFDITFLSPQNNNLSTSSGLSARQVGSDMFPNLTTLIPPPDVSPDGTAAMANLYPLPESQIARLYNRGQHNEHYGFYSYFDRSIFLESLSPLNGSITDDLKDDSNGGSFRDTARVRCTWTQTRFLIQIWTQPTNISGKALFGSDNGDNNPSSPSHNFIRPGTFPYPVTITLDRHGGDNKKKLVYCYGMDSKQHTIQISERKIQVEDREYGGHLVNPAPGIFSDSFIGGGGGNTSSSSWGGTDGGSGGCLCQWVNWSAK